MTVKIYIPDPNKDIENFRLMLETNKAFCFVRFSDGEIEILRNRYLRISPGETIFRGQLIKNNFPQYDSKEFNPDLHGTLRMDLLASAVNRRQDYYKGVPSSHNHAQLDRDFLVRLNGGMSKFMTFSDLLMNSNYHIYRRRIVPLFCRFNDIRIIANYRASFCTGLTHAKHIKIGDNIFSTYEDTKMHVINEVLDAPKCALILSSASSLTNVVGNAIFDLRPDLTFIDVGTSINDMLGLSANSRDYHEAYLDNNWKSFRRKLSVEYWIRW